MVLPPERKYFSERDRDLRESALEALVELDILIEGSDESNEQSHIDNLRVLNKKIEANGVIDVESLDSFKNKDKGVMMMDYVQKNPQYLNEYIAALVNFVARDYLQTKRLNIKDTNFEVMKSEDKVDIEGKDVGVLTPDQLSKPHVDTENLRFMITRIHERLLEKKLVSQAEIDVVRQRIHPK